jgi:hypothetical protein
MYNSGNSSKNVTGSSIVDGTVETVDIADDSVTVDKLANAINTDIATGVTGKDIADLALPSATVDAGWTTYVPTFYENNAATVITITGSSVKYKQIGSVMHIVGRITCASGALTSQIYMSVPVNVGWTGSGTGSDARSCRGITNGNVSAVKIIDSWYYTNKLHMYPSTTDTSLAITATYETA